MVVAAAVKSREESADGTPARDTSSRDKKHMRTYQACIHCRKRKVKCELGDTENPQPPCARCTREQKQCTFAEERRRKRAGESEHTSIDGNESEPDLLADNAGNKRLKISPSGPRSVNPPYTNLRSTPLRRPNGVEAVTDEEDDPLVSNRSASMIQSGDVYSQNDALQLLFKAAQHHHNRTTSASSVFPSQPSNEPTPGSHIASPNGAAPQRTGGMAAPHPPVAGPPPVPDPRATALHTWSRFRFVRAGWIRAEEGMAYLEYFYEHLLPLTPIMVPDYRHPATHKDLLETEPVLALTLLTIASRYMHPAGPGASSRGPIIHDTLTHSLQKEINRTVWGQKQFGGGFCRAGASTKGNVHHLWQTLGTVEALMLLTEWHPRSLHFPPGDDDGELLIPDDTPQNTASEDQPIHLGGPEGRRVDAWLEPCWRSDRMCWMLLGIARSLAYEIGVFDDTPAHEFKANNPELSDSKVQSYFRRKNYLKDLLPIYAALTSGRLELTKNVPRSYLDHLNEERVDRLESRLEKLGLRFSTAAGTQGHVARLQLLDNHPQELVIHLWQEITYILNSGNQKMYPNRKYTAELVESERYKQLLQYYQPQLNDWYQDFTCCKIIPVHMQYILLIEYQYTRAFLNLLALHAVYSRCTRNTPMNRLAQLAEFARDGNPARRSPSAGNDGAIPPSDIRKWMGLDSPYILEVVDACRQIFKIVTDGLLPGEYLKHCPVRTYFRIISAALILLKTFVVGATENEMAISLNLMDGAVRALHTCIVDDVHVGNRFADMCRDLSRRIRQSLIRMTAGGGSGTSRAGTPPATRTTGPIMPLTTPMQLDPTERNQSVSHAPMQWSMMLPTTPGAGIPSGDDTPAHHVWGAPKEVYDPSSNNLSVLPPPTAYYPGFETNGQSGNGNNLQGIDLNKPMHANGFSGNNTPAGGTPFPNMGGDGAHDMAFGPDFGNGMPMSDWLTLPFDGLLNSNSEVIATPNGPAFGHEDMLDRLLWTGGA